MTAQALSGLLIVTFSVLAYGFGVSPTSNLGGHPERRDLKTEGGRQDPAFRRYFFLHWFTNEA